MARSIYFWTLVVVYVLIYWLPVAIAGLLDKSGNFSAAMCRSWARLILRTAGAKVHIDGIEHADFSGSRIYISNHRSYFDVLALMAYLPDNARFVAKKSLEYIPFFGLAMRAVGTVIIDRKRPEAARETLSKMGESNMGKGVGVIIFPEGARSCDGKLGQFKKGGFMLAIQTGATIVPVGITGSSDIMPADGFSVKPGEIHISIGQPISTEGLSIEKRDSVMEKTRNAVNELIEGLTEQRVALTGVVSETDYNRRTNIPVRAQRI